MELFLQRTPKVVYQVCIFVERDRCHRWVVLFYTGYLGFTNPSTILVPYPSLKWVFVLILARCQLRMMEGIRNIVRLRTILHRYFALQILLFLNLFDWFYQVSLDIPRDLLTLFWLRFWDQSLNILTVINFHIYIHVSDISLVNNLVRSRALIRLSSLNLRYPLITIHALMPILSGWSVFSCNFTLLHPRWHERFRCWLILRSLSNRALCQLCPLYLRRGILVLVYHCNFSLLLLLRLLISLRDSLLLFIVYNDLRRFHLRLNIMLREILFIITFFTDRSATIFIINLDLTPRLRVLV